MAEFQDQTDHKPQRLIDRQKEQAGKNHQDDDEPGGDQGLAPRRPSHLIGFGADLLEESEEISHRYRETRCCRIGKTRRDERPRCQIGQAERTPPPSACPKPGFHGTDLSRDQTWRLRALPASPRQGCKIQAYGAAETPEIETLRAKKAAARNQPATRHLIESYITIENRRAKKNLARFPESKGGFTPLMGCFQPLFADEVAGEEGLEPPTPGFGDRCSNQIELHS